MVLYFLKELDTSIIISNFETKVAQKHEIFFAFCTVNAIFFLAEKIKSQLIILYCLCVLFFHLEHVCYFCIGFMSLSKIQCFFVVDQGLDVWFFFGQTVSNFYVRLVILLSFKSCLIGIHSALEVILYRFMYLSKASQSLSVLRLNFKHFFEDRDRLFGRYFTNDGSNFNKWRDVVRFDCKCSFEIVKRLSKVGILQIQHSQIMFYVFCLFESIDSCYYLDGFFDFSLFL